jgi:hypothetical protein
MERQFNFVTSLNIPPGVGCAPTNTISCARELINAVSRMLSVQMLIPYTVKHSSISKIQPVVLIVPPISDRYYTFEFLDAYTNVYAYIGTRATGSTGGTYLITGPDWDGQVPEGMTKIWSPTNLAWFINRILVKGPDDVPNVHAIQDQIMVKSLSVFQGQPVPHHKQQQMLQRKFQLDPNLS